MDKTSNRQKTQCARPDSTTYVLINLRYFFLLQMFHRIMFLFGLTTALECYTCGPEDGKVQYDNSKDGDDDDDDDKDCDGNDDDLL